MNTLQLELMEVRQRLHCEKSAVKALTAKLSGLSGYDCSQLPHPGIRALTYQVTQLHERFSDSCERLSRLEALCVIPALFDPRPQLWYYRKAISSTFAYQRVEKLRAGLDGKVALENAKLRRLIQHEKELSHNLDGALETQNLLFAKASELLKVSSSTRAHSSANSKLRRLIREQNASYYYFDRNAAFLSDKIGYLDYLITEEARAQDGLCETLKVDYYTDFVYCAKLDDCGYQLEYCRFATAAGALTRGLKIALNENQGFLKQVKDLAAVFYQLDYFSLASRASAPTLPTDRAVAEAAIAQVSAALVQQRLLADAREQLCARIYAQLQALAAKIGLEQSK